MIRIIRFNSSSRSPSRVSTRAQLAIRRAPRVSTQAQYLAGWAALKYWLAFGRLNVSRPLT